MNDAVVVSGAGALLAGASGLAGVAQRLAAGRAPATPLASWLPGSRGGARRAVQVSDEDLAGRLPAREARRMSRVSRIAVVAALEAWKDAGFEGPAAEGLQVATAFATAFGPSDVTERILAQILDEGPQAVSPFLFAESVANAAAAQVARLVAARGANIAVTQREAGPLLALAEARYEIEEGRADLALVGAADEINGLLHRILDRYRALARPGEGGEERALPFDERRDGFLAGEGAGVLVLERASAARRRGQPARARVCATASAFDPSAHPWGWGDGAAELAASLREQFARQGVSLTSCDLIVSGAQGSRAGDRLEAATLRAAWEGRGLPPVLTPKAVSGEVGGSLLIAPLLALAGHPMAAPEGGTPAADCMGVQAGSWAAGARPRRVLVSALAAGGAAAWACLEAA